MSVSPAQAALRLRENDPSLSELYFIHMEDGGVQVISDALQQNRILRELVLPYPRFSEASSESLINILQQHPSLRVLQIWNNENLGVVPRAVFQVLAESSTDLQELLLAGDRILPETATLLCTSLHTHSSLKTLYLSSCDLNDDLMVRIFRPSRPITSLESLHLSGNHHIGDRGAQALASVLVSNSSLRHLELSWTGVGDDGLLSLATALTVNTNLQTLDLSHTWSMTCQRGLLGLAQALPRIRGLRELSLGKTKDIPTVSFLENLWRGLERNTTLRELRMSEVFRELPSDRVSVCESKVHYYLVVNKCHRDILNQRHELPLSLWPHILAQVGHIHQQQEDAGATAATTHCGVGSALFYFINELPDLLTR